MSDGNYMYVSCELRRMKIYNWMMVECGQYTGAVWYAVFKLQKLRNCLNVLT